MTACLCVAFGGAIGSVLRYLIGLVPLQTSPSFPYKTLAINIIGSFAIGLIAAAVGNKSKIDPNLVLFLKVGLCGGFTTFSSFALETTDLLRSGCVFPAILYVLLSVILSVTAIFTASAIVR